MDSNPIVSRSTPLDLLRGFSWDSASAWALGFVPIVYLGLDGGGYDLLVYGRVGIAIWWLLLPTVLVGAFPRRRLGTLAWCALALLAAFVAWTALSLGWTESVEKTSADLARVAAYLGLFALALFATGSKGARWILGGVASAITLVAVVGLLSRLHPSWFPDAEEGVRLLPSAQSRLSYPLNYWNGLAALVAIGLPLLLYVATSAKAIVFRALAAAALPALALTVFFTLSRAGLAAAVVALVAYLALSSDRLPKLLTMALAGAGGAILIVASVGRDALQNGLLDATARHQGSEILVMTLVVCAVVGLLQAGLAYLETHRERPQWTVVSRRQSLGALAAGAVVALVLIVALDAPGHASHAWDDFKQANGPGGGSQRLSSLSGEGRYQLWSGAVHENASKPLTGTGSGTFQFWWTRNGTGSLVHDTHSLYLQTLGELGIVGLAVLAAFLLTVLIGGGRATLRGGIRERPQLAAALAGCVAFCAAATFDWLWQIPVLPVTFLLLASTLTASGAPPRGEAAVIRLPLRAAFGLLALAAVAMISIPVASTALVRQSEADYREGDLASALSEARDAQNAQPDAASPRLQQALVLEAGHSLAPASEAARAATERESTNWQTWLVLSRIEAERGRAEPSLRAYRRAKSLNPFSKLFAE